MTPNKLTDAAIRNAQPKAKPYKLSDGGGMFLDVRPAGGKWWRLKYLRREQKARETAQRKAGQGDHRVRVALAIDGQFEVWKGGAVVRLHPEEVAAVRDLLVKLTEVDPWR